MQAKLLVLGCGNDARGDDGLGPAFIERLGAAAIPHIDARYDYQLRVEDAMDIGNYQHVIFVDASRDAQAPFEYHSLDTGTSPLSLDTHSTSPQALMQLARTLFGATTPASVLAIRGYEFEPFVEGLSAQASSNLQSALEYLSRRLRVI